MSNTANSQNDRFESAVQSVNVASLFPTKRNVTQDMALLSDALIVARRNGESAGETMKTFGQLVKRNGFTDAILGASVDAAKFVPLVEVTDEKTGQFKKYTVDVAVLKIENPFLAFLIQTGTKGDELATSYTVTAVKIGQSILRNRANDTDFVSAVEKSADANGQTVSALFTEMESHLENSCRYLLLSEKIRPILAGVKDAINVATSRRMKSTVAAEYSESEESNVTEGAESVAA